MTRSVRILLARTALTGTSALALAALAMLAVPVSPAMANGIIIVPPQNTYNGQTYAEWSAQWFQWVFSLPSTHHPLFDTADCNVGQRGNVWFIGGKLGAASAGLNRQCTIPEGTALFLAVANASFDNTNCNGSTVEQLRALAAQNLEGFLDDRGQCTVDGEPVKKLLGPDTIYRVQSPVFDFTVPSVDNLLVLIDGSCYQDLAPGLLTVSPSVAERRVRADQAAVGRGAYGQVRQPARTPPGTHLSHHGRSRRGLARPLQFK